MSSESIIPLDRENVSRKLQKLSEALQNVEVSSENIQSPLPPFLKNLISPTNVLTDQVCVDIAHFTTCVGQFVTSGSQHCFTAKVALFHTLPVVISKSLEKTELLLLEKGFFRLAHSRMGHISL